MANPGTSELLRQGLIMTALGMGLVFAALALLWGLITLLTRVLADRAEAPAAGDETSTSATIAPGEATPADALTAERARVAALVAGALLAGALPLPVEVPLGPAFEHGRTAPCWVTTNRARALHSWQPPRAAES